MLIRQANRDRINVLRIDVVGRVALDIAFHKKDYGRRSCLGGFHTHVGRKLNGDGAVLVSRRATTATRAAKQSYSNAAIVPEDHRPPLF